MDVSGLDVGAFLTGARLLFPVAACLWLAALLRVRRPAWLLAGVVLANAYAWGVTNFPLQRVYGLGVSPDRVGNLGLVQVVAAGNSPLRTAQVGQLHFEPFWGMVVAVLSGGEPERVLRIYPFLSLLMMAGFTLAVYAGLRPRMGGDSGWERAVAAGFATLLSSTPLDATGSYRVPWALTFLLKPNHALALALFPLVLFAFARIRSWRGRIGVGVLLHVLAWAFVLHMAYVSVGLVVFAALAWLERRPEARSEALDVGVVIGVNALVVSPYLVMLLLGYPFLDSSPRLVIPPWSPHLLETTFRFSAVFALGLWGLRVWQRRGDRVSRLWFGQVVGALAIWLGYLVLGWLQHAREKDEIFYWCRFTVAIAAGVGAWDLIGRFVGEWLAPPARRAALVGLVALPAALPFWWDPPAMDDYFIGSLPPLEEGIAEPMAFLRRETDRQAVVAGDHDLCRYVAAVGARRVLVAANFHQPRDVVQREEAERALMGEGGAEAARLAMQRWGVRYLVVTPAFLGPEPEMKLAALRLLPHLREVHHWSDGGKRFVAIFALEPPR